jgi:C4-dicarboxylate transporter DctM subunit
MEALILFALVLGLLFIGLPVGVALGLSSILFITFFSTDSLSSVAISLFGVGTHYTLLAIPFFIIASSFMSTGGVAKRLINFAIASVGHFRGGLAMASVLACMMFAALSGSSPATVVAIGTIAIAGMRQVGYSKEFASGVIANAGTLGILIPPSIVMVVYAASTDVSVGRMFLAGVIPGLIAGGMLMLAIYVVARIKNLPAEEWKGFGTIVRGGKDAFWGLFLIVIIMGGIYGGAFTPTEAAVVAAFYSIIVALFIYRDMGPLKNTPWVFESDAPHAKVGFNGSVYGVSLFIVWMILSFFATSDPDSTVTAGERALWGALVSVALTIFYTVKRSHAMNESFAHCFVAGLAIWKRNFVVLLKAFLPSMFGEESRKTMLEGTKTTVMLMFIIANALLFAHTLSAERIPQHVT